MKTIIEVFAAYNKSRYKSLKPSQLEFCLKYLEQNQDKEFHQFHKDANRLFMDNKPSINFGVIYEYEATFPKKKNIGTAIELITAVFNSYVNQGK